MDLSTKLFLAGGYASLAALGLFSYGLVEPTYDKFCFADEHNWPKTVTAHSLKLLHRLEHGLKTLANITSFGDNHCADSMPTATPLGQSLLGWDQAGFLEYEGEQVASTQVFQTLIDIAANYSFVSGFEMALFAGIMAGLLFIAAGVMKCREVVQQRKEAVRERVQADNNMKLDDGTTALTLALAITGQADREPTSTTPLLLGQYT